MANWLLADELANGADAGFWAFLDPRKTWSSTRASARSREAAPRERDCSEWGASAEGTRDRDDVHRSRRSVESVQSRSFRTDSAASIVSPRRISPSEIRRDSSSASRSEGSMLARS